MTGVSSPISLGVAAEAFFVGVVGFGGGGRSLAFPHIHAPWRSLVKDRVYWKEHVGQ